MLKLPPRKDRDGIERIFSEEQIDFKLKQKPNWEGLVYGCCETPGCPNYHKVGYYFGGFCKMCSTSTGKFPTTSIRCEWIHKSWVRDLSHLMKPAERREFYMTREQLERIQDRVGYKPKEEEEEEVL